MSLETTPALRVELLTPILKELAESKGNLRMLGWLNSNIIQNESHLPLANGHSIQPSLRFEFIGPGSEVVESEHYISHNLSIDMVYAIANRIYDSIKKMIEQDIIMSAYDIVALPLAVNNKNETKANVAIFAFLSPIYRDHSLHELQDLFDTQSIEFQICGEGQLATKTLKEGEDF